MKHAPLIIFALLVSCKPTKPTDEECSKYAENAATLAAPPGHLRNKVFEEGTKKCREEAREHMWDHWRCIGGAKTLTAVEECKKKKNSKE